MNPQKISRLPKRFTDDLRIIHLTKNWRELLAAKLSNRPFTTVRLRNGIVMTSPPQVALNFLFHEIWIDEFYAPKGFEINANETVVDIGGNIGVFALWAASRAENVRVISFEPFPKNAEYFTANQRLSGLENIEFHAKAVTDEIGKRVLRVDDSWILHSLATKGAAGEGLEVECTSLDAIFEDLQECHLLKLDCEGGEYEILYGASEESLGKINRIVCEFNQNDDYRCNGVALKQFLLSNGFQVAEMKMLDLRSGFICARRTNG